MSPHALNLINTLRFFPVSSCISYLDLQYNTISWFALNSSYNTHSLLRRGIILDSIPPFLRVSEGVSVYFLDEGDDAAAGLVAAAAAISAAAVSLSEHSTPDAMVYAALSRDVSRSPSGIDLT